MHNGFIGRFATVNNGSPIRLRILFDVRQTWVAYKYTVSNKCKLVNETNNKVLTEKIGTVLPLPPS